METKTVILIAAGAAAGGLVIGFIVGDQRQKQLQKATLQGAQQQQGNVQQPTARAA